MRSQMFHHSSTTPIWMATETIRLAIKRILALHSRATQPQTDMAVRTLTVTGPQI